ncbi:MAG: Gfo/Idh/MocA family oxidoreductase [Pirellulales bacterium]
MSRRTRREFLEDSMFATAAALAAGSATQVFAQEEQVRSANETLSVAVLGVNNRGRDHLGGFAGKGSTVVTHICDPDERVGQRQAEGVSRRQNGKAAKYVKDLREVFDDPSVDIVSIATPNHWHALAAIWAIQAGKDVYVEKPVSHNVTEGRRIVDAARKHQKICQTGTQCRTNPGMREAIAFVQEGGIGTVKVGRGLCYKRRDSIGEKGTRSVPEHIDYNLWCGPAPDGPVTRPQFHYDWHWQWAYGNGDLGNQGIHQMDIARWGLGVDSISNAVISYGGRFGYEDAGETANTQVVIHDYDDKTLVFEVRGLETDRYKGADVGVIFEGTDGYMVIASYDSGTAFDKEGNIIKTFRGGASHYDNFVKAVKSRNRDDLNADILEGHLSSALCHLGNISYLLGDEVSRDEAVDRLKSYDHLEDDVVATFERTEEHLAENDVKLQMTSVKLGPMLKIDPVSEQFIDNSTADTMLTRDYRKPFVVPARAADV